jgi:hypothetical protein
MSITYYADELPRKSKPAIQVQQNERILRSVSGSKDITSSALDVTIWEPSNWEIADILLTFSTTTPKNYAIQKIIGRGVVTGLNDRFYLRSLDDPPQKIVLDQGFYNGTQMATELKTQLDANAAFVAAGIAPFTVSYNATTGLFTITPAAGTIQYLHVNDRVPVRRNSTAGPVLGFTANTALSASVISDTAVAALGTAVDVLSATASANVDIVSNDLLPMDVDQSLAINTNTAAVTASYKVTYRLLGI